MEAALGSRRMLVTRVSNAAAIPCWRPWPDIAPSHSRRPVVAAVGRAPLPHRVLAGRGPAEREGVGGCADDQQVEVVLVGGTGRGHVHDSHQHAGVDEAGSDVAGHLLGVAEHRLVDQQGVRSWRSPIVHGRYLCVGNDDRPAVDRAVGQLRVRRGGVVQARTA